MMSNFSDKGVWFLSLFFCTTFLFEERARALANHCSTGLPVFSQSCSFSNSSRSHPNEQCVPGHQPAGRALSMFSVTCWLPTWKTTYLQVMGDSRTPKAKKNVRLHSSKQTLSPPKEDSQERPAALESKTENLISCCSLILISCLKQISTSLREQKIITCLDGKWD